MFNQRGSLAQESPELFTAIVHVVQDDADLRENLDGLLTSVGLKHRMYEKLDEFLDSEAGLGRGCIVLDIPSSGVSGTELARLIRKRDVNYPLILIETQDEHSPRNPAQDLGEVEVLPKTCSVQHLLETVSKALALIRRT